MKKFVLASVSSALFLTITSAPAFANVIRPNNATTGHPIAAVSNTGSTQGVANRSATGTTSKFTNDGTRPIWIE